LSSLAIAAGASAQDAVQWRVEDGGNGHWYQFVTQEVSWTAARANAESVGGHLVTLGSEAEHVFTASLPGVSSLDCNGPFIGLRQAEGAPEPAGGWYWITGEPLSYTNWGIGLPSNEISSTGISANVGLMGCAPSRRWADIQDRFDLTVESIIEWSADCNADGIVDFGQIRAGELEDANSNNIPDCCEQSTSCPINLIENGGFEIGPTQTDCTWVAHGVGSAFVPGWSVIAVSVDRERLSANCPITTESWMSYEGEFTIDLDGGASGGAIRQVVATTPNAQYRLTFQLTGNCGDTSIKTMFVRVGGASTAFEHACQSTNPQPWNEKVVEFIATDALTTIDFVSSMTDGRNGPVIDGVRLVQIADPCSADIDQSGTVNAVDLAAILTVWGTDGGKYPRADINADGEVNGPDLAAVLSNWGSCP
jgi:choice-of-anchor C domain-containing protein